MSLIVLLSHNRYMHLDEPFSLVPHGGYPRKTGQLEDSHRDLKCRKARPRWLRIQKPEALMLQSVPPYVDTPHGP